ncbi:hypothetical protein [Chryseobacterium paridis]|uniref:Lipocalin-like domain-containing protein n=1 Tax=Chryseobacterium paridis TaxID=2800328 RepID=A0ABS1FWH3_9FLAO|nr:hypothetical protein [Chryseobacterium paridis]MBK1896800.1 hypothetical protein [Chryseobacterium paridis]
MKKTVLILLLFLSFFVFGQENLSKAGGPPKLSELIGFWKKVELPNENTHNKENPWPQKYQWFAFYENGKVYSMMSDKDYNYSVKDLKEIFSSLPLEKTPTYKLDGQFLTIDNKEIENYQELWGVNLFAMDIENLFKKGNLMMTLDDGSGNVIYYRLLEKLNN